MTNAFQDARGNTSSTRIIGGSVIFGAIVVVLLGMWLCFKHPENASSIILALAALFTAMTSPTFIWLYGNKAKELLTYFNKKKDASDTDSQS
jgi:hypothetical protein